MNSPVRFSLIVAACCIIGGGPVRAGERSDRPDLTPNPCEQAGMAEEQKFGLPDGLLLAIGRAESGRWDAARGRVAPWPWTINAAGRGQRFDSKEEAIQTVGALLHGGTRSIDVGCFQISLLHHPLAFSSLEQAFDPAANARYATGFLISLYGRTGSWEAAVEAYHSADPVRGYAYRQQVFSTWGTAAPLLASASIPVRAGAPVASAAPPVRALPIPMIMAGVRIWTPMPAGTAPGIVVMPGAPDQPAAPSTMAPLPVVLYKVMPRR